MTGLPHSGHPGYSGMSITRCMKAATAVEILGAETAGAGRLSGTVVEGDSIRGNHFENKEAEKLLPITGKLLQPSERICTIRCISAQTMKSVVPWIVRSLKCFWKRGVKVNSYATILPPICQKEHPHCRKQVVLQMQFLLLHR